MARGTLTDWLTELVGVRSSALPWRARFPRRRPDPEEPRNVTYPPPPQPQPESSQQSYPQSGVPGGAGHPPGQHSGGYTPGRQGGGWGRVLLVALLIGTVVAAVAGVGGYVGSRTYTGGDAAVRCGDADLCFATLDADHLTGFLAGQGFECELGRECELRTAGGRYIVTLSVPGGDGQVHRYEATVESAPGVELPGAAEEYLTWFAGLPFGEDSAGASEAQQWLTAHRRAGGDSTDTATIGSYEYALVHREGLNQMVRLVVEAGETVL